MQSLIDAIATLAADESDPNSMPIDKARAFISGLMQSLSDAETLALPDALFRVLAADVLSPSDVPPHRNAGMDGYAIGFEQFAADREYSIVATSFAGVPLAPDFKLAPNECIRIFTGAVVPNCCDVVIMQERADANGNTVSFESGVKRDQNIRHAGEDLKAGEITLAKGRQLRPAELGLLASLGLKQVSVIRKLRVAFFSSGDELVAAGTPLQPGQIYDSNSTTIAAMLTRMGAECLNMGSVRDDPALLEAALVHAANDADVVISSGGVSVGEADFIKGLLKKIGEVVFWKIAMKPGRPLAYGKIRRTTKSAGEAHFFGLPGNPVSTMVTFYQIVRPALMALQGIKPIPLSPTFKVECVSPIKKATGRTEFQRGTLFTENGQTKVRTTGAQGSGILKSLSDANCFIILGDDVGNVAAGALVDVQVLDGIV
jgi:molybdopterin molybdotransferase